MSSTIYEVNGKIEGTAVREGIRISGGDVDSADVVSISPQFVRRLSRTRDRTRFTRWSRPIEGEHDMSRITNNTKPASLPATIRVAAIRVGLALAVAASLLAFAVRADAQPSTSTQLVGIADFAPVPFTVGEELIFRATFGGLPAGTARMRVDGIEFVRGRPAYHVVFAIDGGIPLYRVHDRYESWIDVVTLSSLRHTQSISEGRYHRNTTYEIYAERGEFQKNSDEPRPTVSNPLDDASFIYAVRTMGLRAGDTVRNDRYFIPDRNPVVLTGLREDTVTVAAGTFATTVVRPSIKTTGIFSQNGDAQVWFTNDERRLPVMVKTHFATFSLTLALQSVTPGATTAVAER